MNYSTLRSKMLFFVGQLHDWKVRVQTKSKCLHDERRWSKRYQPEIFLALCFVYCLPESMYNGCAEGAPAGKSSSEFLKGNSPCFQYPFAIVSLQWKFDYCAVWAHFLDTKTRVTDAEKQRNLCYFEALVQIAVQYQDCRYPWWGTSKEAFTCTRLGMGRNSFF